MNDDGYTDIMEGLKLGLHEKRVKLHPKELLPGSLREFRGEFEKINMHVRAFKNTVLGGSRY